MNKIKGLLVKTDGTIKEIEITQDGENTNLNEVYETIGCDYVELPRYRGYINKDNIHYFCDEEGKIKESTKFNFGIRFKDYFDLVFGDILFISVNDCGVTESLTNEEITQLTKEIETIKKVEKLIGFYQGMSDKYDGKNKDSLFE